MQKQAYAGLKTGIKGRLKTIAGVFRRSFSITHHNQSITNP
ncbi:hypothetical protein HMPREF9370_0255 [Neisseria wadsworthii 9715]|uniref:Uncharacterized protein n=1 Tax=Neisseria wadsworthii 9715 TaxID=1030841 RepID=G4CME6_9NEIS|nr:hypothetical protein HMPREF9370_0255 [Neisseria wadsworthii 9715]